MPRSLISHCSDLVSKSLTQKLVEDRSTDPRSRIRNLRLLTCSWSLLSILLLVLFKTGKLLCFKLVHPSRWNSEIFLPTR
jgi:hypothetical protein